MMESAEQLEWGGQGEGREGWNSKKGRVWVESDPGGGRIDSSGMHPMQTPFLGLIHLHRSVQTCVDSYARDSICLVKIHWNRSHLPLCSCWGLL